MKTSVLLLVALVATTVSAYAVESFNSTHLVGEKHPLPVVGENELDGFTYVYKQLGDFIVISTAKGTVSKKDLDTGTATTSTTQKYIKNIGGLDGVDDAGHIRANRLGGSGRDPINLFPQYCKINRGEYRSMEAEIHDGIAEGTYTHACLSWKFTYSGKDPRPVSYTYTAKMCDGAVSSCTGCKSVSKDFDNPTSPACSE
eukprot:Colp12_sorted_trinity150504_noHs@25394